MRKKKKGDVRVEKTAEGLKVWKRERLGKGWRWKVKGGENG